MKIFITFFLFLITNSYSSANLIKINSLYSFSKQNHYLDNRVTLKKDKIFKASKGCCNSETPFSILEAFGTDLFNQIALSCDQCKVSQISQLQIEYCKAEFQRLYKHLFHTNLPKSINKKIEQQTKGKPNFINLPILNQKIRISSQLIKCDSQDGLRLRIDLFSN
jgi:hypothetical protein